MGSFPQSLELSENDQRRPLRIGIVGGGLVGATAAIALLRLPDVSVTVFERSPEAREAGGWITITTSGLAVLDKLIDLKQIDEIVYRGGINGAPVVRHWRTGKILARNSTSAYVAARYIQARTHRVPLLNVLLSNIPRGVIQYSREYVKHKILDEGVRLEFTNGPSEVFDLVVAADGLYSRLRRQYEPVQVLYQGRVAYRKIFPYSRVAHIKGLPDDSSGWRRNGEVVFLSQLGRGQYGIVAIIPESIEYASTLKWSKSVGKEGLDRLRTHFADWNPIVKEVLRAMDDIDAYPLDSGPWLKNLTREDRIAFVGDAAHPTAGAYGAGASIGYADAWALYRAIQESVNSSTTDYQSANGRYNIPRALKLFNETRRHYLDRVEMQFRLDAEVGKYLSAAKDDDEWTKRYVEKERNPHWLMEHDVEAEFVKILTAEILWLPQTYL